MVKIGVIGPNRQLCGEQLYAFGTDLGRKLATPHRAFICGGMGGFMEAVCVGAKQSPDTFTGQTVGILPGETSDAANPWVDLAIPTGMGEARNLVIVRTSDILVAAGGGAGTLSEMAFAWKLGKTVLCVSSFLGWAAQLAGKDLDDTHQGLLVPINEVGEIVDYLAEKGY